MFNPLTAAQMTTAVGRAARAAARSDGPLDAFDRTQLLSAYSATRHLAVELDAFAPELRDACAEVAAAAERSEAGIDAELCARLREADGGAEAGEAIATLLEICRTRAQEVAIASLRAEVQRCLRALCDREVGLLAEAIEAGR